MFHKSPLKTLTATALLTLLAAAGCSSTEQSGSSSAPSGVYEFTDFSNGPSKEITVRVPDDLLEAAGVTREDLLAQSITITAHPLDSAEYCAVDQLYEYTDGVIGKPFTSEQRESDPYGDNVGESDADVLAHRIRQSTMEYQPDCKIALPISELDVTAPEKGQYFSQDLKTVTVVTDCAKAPSDVDTLDSWNNHIKMVSFDVETKAHGGTRLLANVGFNVMRDGTVTVISPETDGFVRDANGYWVSE